MLFLHETHDVRGVHEADFEAAYRDIFMAELAKSDEGRLLWFCRQAHGSGPAYRFVTITALADGAAWEELASRVQRGDFRDWARHVDELRHGVAAKLLHLVEWSPLQDLKLSDVPTDGTTHASSLYMEDTGWPHAALDDYLRFWDERYVGPMSGRPKRLLDVQAVFQPAFGAGPRKEAILLQKVLDHVALLHVLGNETPQERLEPGQFMHDALDYRDRWESRLLRTSPWSPLH